VQIRIVASALLAAVFVVGIGAAAFWAADTTGQEGQQPESPYGCGLPSDFEKFPAEKQVVELEELAECEAAEAGYHAPKIPDASPVLSCPLDVKTVVTGVFPYNGGPFGRYVVNEASAVSSRGVPYRIFAGALDPDSQQGVLLVLQQSIDPCATAAGLLPHFEPQSFTLPVKTGGVTLTAIEGDLVSFETAGGNKGQFNYTTGEFLIP